MKNMAILLLTVTIIFSEACKTKKKTSSLSADNGNKSALYYRSLNALAALKKIKVYYEDIRDRYFYSEAGSVAMSQQYVADAAAWAVGWKHIGNYINKKVGALHRGEGITYAEIERTVSLAIKNQNDRLSRLKLLQIEISRNSKMADYIIKKQKAEYFNQDLFVSELYKATYTDMKASVEFLNIRLHDISERVELQQLAMEKGREPLRTFFVEQIQAAALSYASAAAKEALDRVSELTQARVYTDPIRQSVEAQYKIYYSYTRAPYRFFRMETAAADMDKTCQEAKAALGGLSGKVNAIRLRSATDEVNDMCTEVTEHLAEERAIYPSGKGLGDTVGAETFQYVRNQALRKCQEPTPPASYSCGTVQWLYQVSREQVAKMTLAELQQYSDEWDMATGTVPLTGLPSLASVKKILGEE